MEVEKIVQKRMTDAKLAESECKILLDMHPEEDVRFIFFPKESDEVRKYGLLYLDTHLSRMNAKNAVIIYEDTDIAQIAPHYSERIIDMFQYSNEQMNRFLTLYSLCEIDPRIIVVSLDRPYCRWGSRLINVHGTTIEELVAIGIYRIIPFEKISPKEETKNDKDII